MAVTYQILARRGVVYVRFEGKAVVAESFDALARLARDPEYRPDHSQLIDLTGVTDVELDYVELFKLHARKAEMFESNNGHMLVVYVAPTEVSLGLANLITRSWDGVKGLTNRIAQNEAEALDILGLPHGSIAMLIGEEA
ncbi:MAG: hypothetical protein ACRBBU_05100 [Pseudooceanicola sp.]